MHCKLKRDELCPPSYPCTCTACGRLLQGIFKCQELKAAPQSSTSKSVMVRTIPQRRYVLPVRSVTIDCRLHNRVYTIYGVTRRSTTLRVNIACTKTIILAAHKITCGKKGQEKKIFQCYVIQGVGMLNIMT